MTQKKFLLLYPRASKLLKQISNNRKDGASVLFSQTILALEVLHKESQKKEDKIFLKSLQLFLGTLTRSHPSMAPFYHLASSFQARTLTKAKAWKKLTLWKSYLKKAQREILTKAGKIISDYGTILTHSASSTVRKILSTHKNKIKKVYVTESLPGGEGKIFFRLLKKEKVPVHLIKDGEVQQKLKEADIFLIGADTVCRNYFINKVGTKKIAQFAVRENVPVAVACEKIKFVPEGMPIAAKKPLFEKIPNKLVKYWIADPIRCQP